MQDEVIEQNLQFKYVVNTEGATKKPESGQAYIFSEGKFLPILGVQPGGTMTTIPRPERDALDRGVTNNTENLLQGAPQSVFKIEKIDYTDDGIYIYHEGLLHPKKGFVYPEAVQANNVVKKVLAGAVRAFSKNYLLMLLLIRRKTLQNFLEEFHLLAKTTISQFYWKHEYYSKTAKEIDLFITSFLFGLGFTIRLQGIGRIIAHLFEFDDAYMFRFQDIMNETTKKALLENPAKEISRLFKIFKERESRMPMKDKIGAVYLLFKLMFFIPKVRKAFKKAVSEMNIGRCQMEECDVYQVLRWDNGYNFLGRTAQSRVEELKELHKNSLLNFKILTV